MILIEKGLRLRNRNQEFYLVFVVNTDDGSWPEELTNLVSSTFGGSFRKEKVARDEVRRFAVTGVDAIDNVVVIPFSAPKIASIKPPWSAMQENVTRTPIDSRQAIKKYEQLLYWVSYTSAGSINAIANACAAFGLCQESVGVHQLLRRLRLLGHIELTLDGSRWSACPPALARLPDSDGALLFGLYGQRSASLIKKLQALAKKTEGVLQHGSDGPPFWRFQFSDEEDAAKAAEQTGRLIRHVVNADRLSEIVPSLEQWKQTLENAQGIIPALYEARRWQDDLFISVYNIQESGLYELTRRDTESGVVLNLYFDAPTGRWLKGDWYGLRFLANYTQGTPLRAVFVGSKLAIPLEQRWPFIYEKSLVLLSGLLPTQMEQNWLVYQDVPLKTAENLCERLSVTLQK
jgi:hypothetical protein